MPPSSACHASFSDVEENNQDVMLEMSPPHLFHVVVRPAFRPAVEGSSHSHSHGTKYITHGAIGRIWTSTIKLSTYAELSVNSARSHRWLLSSWNSFITARARSGSSALRSFACSWKLPRGCPPHSAVLSRTLSLQDW